MPKHYLGLSTGPLTSTFLEARKTREAWTASYLFSRLMKHLVDAVKDAGGEVLAPRPPTATAHFVKNFAPASAPNETPLAEGDDLNNDHLFGTGIYPDRLFAYFVEVAEDQLSDTPTSIRETAVKALSKEVLAVYDEKKRLTEAATIRFYADYFRIAAVWLPAEQRGDNLLLTLNQLLDTQELQPAYLPKAADPDPLITLLEKPYTSEMVRDGLTRHPQNPFQGQVEASVQKEKGGIIDLGYDLFPSTAHIASVGLYHHSPGQYWLLQNQLGLALEPAKKGGKAEKDETDGEEWMKFFRLLDQKEVDTPHGQALIDHYEEYHKYFCIVHADGDRFGKTIEKLGNDHEKIIGFSEKLAAFAAEAAGIINAHNGKPIYVGGDDLLFFCPLVTYRSEEKDNVTVLDLIKALDERFKAHDFDPMPTLSYGLTVSHYKYPLFEAKDDSFAALLRAKKTQWPDKAPVGGNTAEKDAIAFRFIRHSGSYFDGTLDKTLLNDWNALFQLGSNAKFLSSFVYKLRELEPLFDAIPTLDAEAVATTVANFFDEGIHDANRPTLDKLAAFYAKTLNTRFTNGENSATPRNNAYALLRLLYFCLPEPITEKTRPHAATNL